MVNTGKAARITSAPDHVADHATVERRHVDEHAEVSDRHLAAHQELYTRHRDEHAMLATGMSASMSGRPARRWRGGRC
jgi:hypothetical protein